MRGWPTYLGSSHELYSDLWTAALKAGQSSRAGKPQAKHDFTAMSDEELGSFFRGLHAGTLATVDNWLQPTTLLVSITCSTWVAGRLAFPLRHAQLVLTSKPQWSSCRELPRLRKRWCASPILQIVFKS